MRSTADTTRFLEIPFLIAFLTRTTQCIVIAVKARGRTGIVAYVHFTVQSISSFALSSRFDRFCLFSLTLVHIDADNDNG